jgi:hypothetical protein
MDPPMSTMLFVPLAVTLMAYYAYYWSMSDHGHDRRCAAPAREAASRLDDDPAERPVQVERMALLVSGLSPR